ncbi:OLC1v1006496C1 [Oldenlandia corymbosa var. corymbosa]|uniref:OLC1v1006496C1 n=1 Tax=Oldenlandia corymbosa var. corymbosa TaxID=529605 RepID=A0AAV1DK69_OLDCO|nr:OLC1v1006496C1 [Oldenlandia corymbosa var. corymbosa]
MSFLRKAEKVDDDPQFEKRTTTLGFIFNNAEIMVSLEHSSCSSGSIPENVALLNSHLLAAVSGGHEYARKFYLAYLQTKCRQHEGATGARASAAEASRWLADFLSYYRYSDDGLSLGTLIAGWDDKSGPALYKVSAKGKLSEEPFLGSGCAMSRHSMIT